MAIAAAAGIGALGSLGAGAMMSSASSSAAQAQEAAAMSANQLQWKMFEQNQANMQPWLTQGTAAENILGQGVLPGGQFSKFTLKDFQSNPGYQFQKQEGINALGASGAASGNYGSGNMGVALQNWGQNVANQDYNNAYSQWQDSYNRLAGVAGTGQVASQNLGALGSNAATAIGANTIGAGNAAAAGMIGSANAWSNALRGMNNTAMGGFGTYLNQQNQQNMMNQLFSGGGMSDSAFSGAMNAPFSGGSSYDMGGWGGGSSDSWYSGLGPTFQ